LAILHARAAATFSQTIRISFAWFILLPLLLPLLALENTRNAKKGNNINQRTKDKILHTSTTGSEDIGASTTNTSTPIRKRKTLINKTQR
jgi:hypothetical protein